MQKVSSWRENSVKAEIIPPRLSIKDYIKAKNVPYLYEVARCESNFKETASGDSGIAYGIFQFHKATFDGFARNYNLDLDYKNPYDQADLATLMFQDGYQYHWSCYKLVSLN